MDSEIGDRSHELVIDDRTNLEGSGVVVSFDEERFLELLEQMGIPEEERAELLQRLILENKPLSILAGYYWFKKKQMMIDFKIPINRILRRLQLETVEQIEIRINKALHHELGHLLSRKLNAALLELEEKIERAVRVIVSIGGGAGLGISAEMGALGSAICGVVVYVIVMQVVNLASPEERRADRHATEVETLAEDQPVFEVRATT